MKTIQKQMAKGPKAPRDGAARGAQDTNRAVKIADPLTQNVVRWLRQELSDRVRRNPTYSLRAFAESLEINHSQLVRLLNGTRACSTQLKRRLELKLGPLSSSIQNDLHSAPGPAGIDKKTSVESYAAIEAAQFAVVADWEHYAIRELVCLSKSVSSVAEVAEALNISRLRAEIAIDRLLTLGLIRRDGSGALCPAPALENVTNQMSMDQTFTSAAHRQLQRAILARAIQAIDIYDVNERDQSSMTMSIDSARLPEAIRMITEFRRTLCQFLEGGRVRDRVYQLSISLFPETPRLNEKKTNTKKTISKSKELENL